ncbi:MAG: 1-acyl-sn-glycerol-3-phosphate acyltransferase [Candidatus Omnitrophota bacterium]|nr:MAG: 1-acyl-sn-glycerol-3-phosphate acyltransferase [Candidatus Omnitrophota bacterium]
MLYRVIKFLSFGILVLFFKLEVRGRGVFPRNKPFILASNHLSNLDPVILGTVCPRKLNFLAKEELFTKKLFAFFLKNVGAIPLKRNSPDIRSIRLAMRILKRKPLVIFPQGQRGADYDRFRAGVGFLYKRTSVPIIAAKIYGTNTIMPKGNKIPKRGKVKVSFERVSNFKGRDSYEDIASKVIETIKSL